MQEIYLIVTSFTIDKFFEIYIFFENTFEIYKIFENKVWCKKNVPHVF